MVIFHRFLYVYQRVYQIPIRLGDTFLCIKSGFSNLKFHCWHPHVRWDVSSFNHIFSTYFEETSINHRYGYGSIPINTIFRGMNIHLPAILMFTVQGFDTLPYGLNPIIHIFSIVIIWSHSDNCGQLQETASSGWRYPVGTTNWGWEIRQSRWTPMDILRVVYIVWQ